MQRAKAPARSIKTKGFIRGRKMLLNPGMIPHRLQQNRKKQLSASCCGKCWKTRIKKLHLLLQHTIDPL